MFTEARMRGEDVADATDRLIHHFLRADHGQALEDVTALIDRAAADRLIIEYREGDAGARPARSKPLTRWCRERPPPRRPEP